MAVPQNASVTTLPQVAWPEALEWTNRFWSLGEDYFSRVPITPLDNARVTNINTSLAAELGASSDFLQGEAFRAVVNGEASSMGLSPIASVYSGHQFGVWAGQLGDGRAMLLGEQKTPTGAHWEWQLKGSGLTPYSRRGDGRAVLRSTIREYLCSEAMHALGIPTTRALAMLTSETPVYRETVETGALLLRLAPSHLRFGHIEHFYYHDAVQGVPETLDALLGFVLENYYPQYSHDTSGLEAWFAEVVTRTAELMAHWQAVGFNHGVMNTDNMSLLGLTMDYGPFGFLEAYDPQHICNHSDHEGRYSFQNQPYIGQWNCAALGQALAGVISTDAVNAALQTYRQTYQAAYTALMFQKLGLLSPTTDDLPLLADLLKRLAADRVDYTRFFRTWSEYPATDMPRAMSFAFPTEGEAFASWVETFSRRLERDPASAWTEAERQAQLQRLNPLRVLRNYWAQHVIEAAQAGDFSPVDQLLAALQSPYERRAEWADFDSPAPSGSPAICVSCSS